MTVKYPVRGVVNRGADCYAIAICQAVGAAAGATKDFDLGSNLWAEAIALKIREIRCSGSSEPVAAIQPLVLRSILGIEISDEVLTVHQSAAEFFKKVAETCSGRQANALLGYKLKNGILGSGLIFHMGAGESTLPELLRCEEMISDDVGVDFELVPNLVAVEVVRKLDDDTICRREVNFPESITIETLGSPVQMYLAAMVLHSGDSDLTGHYTCIVKNSDGQSYLCNDAKIAPLTAKVVEEAKKNAVLLFYCTAPLGPLLPIVPSPGQMSDDGDGSDASDSDYSDSDLEEDAQIGEKCHTGLQVNNHHETSYGAVLHQRCCLATAQLSAREKHGKGTCNFMSDSVMHLANVSSFFFVPRGAPRPAKRLEEAPRTTWSTPLR